jgi:L-alanine-DL-glutamate epimerase-like enolase superfamily enzyme
MTTVKDIYFREITRPLRVTFATAKGQKDVMRSVIIRVILADGSSGLGECPTSISLSKETIPVIKTILNEVRRKIKDMPIDEYDSVIEQLRMRYPNYPMTISGLEVASFRANLASKGITEHAFWGGKTRIVRTDVTIPFVLDRTFLCRWLKYTFRKGFTTFKLKVSGDVEVDKKIISYVHSTLKSNLEQYVLRLDGNQGYNKRSFQQITDYIEKEGYIIELFEQPLPKDDYPGFKAIKKSSPFPIILDETVLTGFDAQRAAEEDLAHGINIKMAKSGIAQSAAILAVAKEHGLQLMIGCMTETMTGLSSAVYFASGTGVFDYIDLDAIFFLHHKNQYNDLTLEGPCFVLGSL